MPFTTGKGFSVQATGTNAGTWGSDSTTPTANSSNALNEGAIQLIDQALAGTTTLSLSSSAVLLTQIQAQKGMLRCTGTLLANITISPDSGVLMTGFYAWENVTTGSYTVTLSNSAGSVVLPQSRRGLFWIDTTNAPRIIAIASSSNADPIPSGTVMSFFQAAAPAGWTVSNSYSDYGIRIVTGTSALGGSTFNSARAYSTVFGLTATDSYTLTLSEIPSHTHTTTLYDSLSAPGGGSVGVQRFTVAGTGPNTGSSGGGNGHSHAIDLRVQTVNMILATKV